MKLFTTVTAALLMLATLSACSPEPGSEAWCKKINDTPKSDWSANDAGTYAKYCILGQYKK